MWSLSGSDWYRAALVFSAAAALATWPVGRARTSVATAPTPAPEAAPIAPTIVAPVQAPIPNAPAAPKPTNVLAVRVTAGGLAKPSAEVSLSDGSRPTLATAITDHEGIARFAQLAPGAYEVWARHETMVSNLARIDELATKPEVALELLPGAALKGQVVADAAIPRANVTLIPVDVDHVMRVATADTTGKFTITGLPFGRWRMEGAVAGHVQAADQIIEVKAPRETEPTPEVALRMLRAGAVAGLVVDGNGAPVANATIVLRKQGAQLTPIESFAGLGARQVRWVHPLAGRRVLPFGEYLRFGASRPGARPAECGMGHCGVDIGSVRGTVIHAAADGEIALAHVESHGEAGRAIAIDHGHGLKTYYMHLDELRPGLEVGQRIRAGEALGAMGDTGFARGPHLHFALSQEREGRVWYVDPEPVLQHAVVLQQPRKLDPIDAKDARLIAAIRREAGPASEPARSFTTDAQGRYRVDGVAPGSYVAVAFSPSLAPGSSEAFLIRSGSDTGDIRITMHPGVLVQGRVVGRDGPVAGASVTAGAGGGESAAKVATTTTSTTGDFTLRALSGAITLSVTAPGHGVVERQLALGDYGPRRREDFSLLIENAQLRGQVLAADGGPAPNVTVRVVEGPTRRQVITDRTGRFTIDRAAAGNYVLEIGGGEFPVKRAAAQADRWTELRLERGGQLRVDLRDARSVAPLAGLVVEARGPGDRTAAATTDASGIANLRALTPGEWTIEIRAKGYTRLTKTVVVRPSLDEVRLSLARSTTLAGVVRDRRGARVANVRVFADGVSTTADSLGNFRLADAPAGTYWLEAEVDGVRGAVRVQVEPGDERTTLEIELPR